MDRKTDLRLWAVLFWLAVWQIAAMALAAVYPHGELLLASPLMCCAAGAAGRHRRLLADGGLVRRPDLRRISARHGVGGRAGGTGGVETVAPGADGPLVAAVKTVPVASFIILALVWLNSQSLSLFISALMVFPPVYLNVLEGICRTDPSASGNGPGVPGPLWAAAPGHLSAAGDALFPHGGIFGPGPLLESRGSGGDHRLARRVHGRAAVHRQGLLPDGRSVCMDRYHCGGVSGV